MGLNYLVLCRASSKRPVRELGFPTRSASSGLYSWLHHRHHCRSDRQLADRPFDRPSRWSFLRNVLTVELKFGRKAAVLAGPWESDLLRFPGLCREVSQATRRRLMSAAAARSASAARGPGRRSSRRGRRRRGATSRAEHREQPDAVLMTVGAHRDGVGLRHGAALFERCATGATSEFVQRHRPSSLCGYLGLDKARSVRIEPRSSVDRKTGQPGGR